MTGATGRTALFAAGLVLALLFATAGCGGDGSDTHSETVTDPHAGHDHAAGETEHEGDERGAQEDGHEGDDHATEEAGHEGHDHGTGEAGGSPVLSERDRDDAGITLAVAGPGHIDVRSRLLGEVRMNEERLAHVVPPVGGTIREVKVRVGDEVKAGRTLAVLASRELAEARAAYLGARGRRELAQIDHDREKELWERDILAEQDYLDARQALLEADIELQAAEQTLHALGTSDEELVLLEENHEAGALTRLELRAPISGTVTELHMVLGETVGEDSDVAVVADLGTVWVDLDVPQSQLDVLRRGQEVTVSASGAGVPDARGVVNFVSPVVDEETRTVLVRVELPNHAGQWRPGLFVTASVASEHHDVAVAVPKAAVQQIEDEQVVFVPEGTALVPVVVTTGVSGATHVEILTGLEQGQRYVAEGAFALKAEMITSGLDPHAGHGH